MSETSTTLQQIDEEMVVRVIRALDLIVRLWQRDRLFRAVHSPSTLRESPSLQKLIAEIATRVNRESVPPDNAVPNAIAESGFAGPANEVSHFDEGKSPNLGNGAERFLRETGG